MLSVGLIPGQLAPTLDWSQVLRWWDIDPTLSFWVNQPITDLVPQLWPFLAHHFRYYSTFKAWFSLSVKWTMSGQMRWEMNSESLLSSHLPAHICPVISKEISKNTSVFLSKNLGPDLSSDFAPIKWPRFPSYVLILQYYEKPSTSNISRPSAIVINHKSLHSFYYRCLRSQGPHSRPVWEFFSENRTSKARKESCK